MVESILEELVVEQRSGVGHDLNDPHHGADQDGCTNFRGEKKREPLEFGLILFVKTSPFVTLRTCLDPSNLGKAQRIRHSQVSVQRDAAQEGDADVDVRVEDEAKQLAAPLAVDPVIVLQEVVDPQRKSGDVEKVGHGQVDQVDAELIALAYLEGRGEKERFGK